MPDQSLWNCLKNWKMGKKLSTSLKCDLNTYYQSSVFVMAQRVLQHASLTVLCNLKYLVDIVGEENWLCINPPIIFPKKMLIYGFFVKKSLLFSEMEV